MNLLYDKYLFFNSDNEYVQVSADSALEPSNGTVECLVYLTASGINGGDLYSILNTDRFTGGTPGGWHIKIDDRSPANRLLRFVIRNSAGTPSTIDVNLPLVTRIYHIAMTWVSGTSFKVYVDGDLIDETGCIVPNTSSNSLIMGNRDTSSFNFNNGLQEVRIWNVARTQQQIQDNMQNELIGTESGLVAYWKLDEGTGTVANDSVSTRDGTISNASWETSPESLPASLTLAGEQSVGEVGLRCLAEYNNKLYGGTNNEANLLEYDDIDTLVQVAGRVDSYYTYLIELLNYNSKLYGIGGGALINHSELLEWNDADSWVKVSNSLANTSVAYDLKEYNSSLYVCYNENEWVGKVGKWNGVDTISLIQNFGDDCRDMEIHNGDLYLTTDENLYIFDEGTETFSSIATYSSTGELSSNCLKSFDGKLYVPDGGYLKYWNGSTLITESTNATVDDIYDIEVFNDDIYLTNQNGYFYKLVGTTLTLVSYGYSLETAIYKMAIYNNTLYIGSAPNCYLLSFSSGDPVVTTNSVTNVSETTATLNGEVDSEGNSSVTERGFVYNTTGSPNITDDTKVTVSGTTGTYSYNLTGLTASTTYYVRAYATNSEGTGYGSIVSFTTEEGYSVSTDAVTNLKATTVTLNGTVNGTIYDTIERGFAYGTSTSPDILSDTKVPSGSGAGSFDEDITNLLPKTTYYVRAYAKYYDESSILTTVYGDQVSFETDLLVARLKYHNGTEWVLYPRPPIGTENQVIVTDNLNTTYTFSLPQDIHTGATPEFVSALLSGLTASRLVATDGAKTLESVTNLANFISGTTNQITISDDGDGTITISTPQDIHTGATPTFVSTLLSGLTANRLISTDGTKTLESIADLTAWIAGTSGNLTVTDDGDGTVTLKAIGSVVNVTTLTDTDTLTLPQQGTIKCNKATAMTVNLPTASGNTGLSYFISNINTGTVTIDPNGSETLMGETTFDLYQYENIQIVSDGTQWILR